MPQLFNAFLEGVGTKDVECLGSFIHRLAYKHSVTAAELLRFCFSSDIGTVRTSDTGQISQAPQWANLAICSRPNASGRLLSERLKFATGRVDLASGTFQALGQALDRSSGAYARSLRWCPSCMAEWLRLGDPGYYKLIWQAYGARQCDIHHVDLVDRCRTCESVQGKLGHKGPPTECERCSEPLGWPPDQVDFTNSWYTTSSDLSSVVSHIGNDPDLLYPPGGVRKVLNEEFDRAWELEKESTFWQLIPKQECIALITGIRPVTLEVARRIAYMFGMDLDSVLEGAPERPVDILDLAWIDGFPKEMKPKRRRPPHRRTQLLSTVQSILSDYSDADSPTLKEVAERARLSTGGFEYHFPDLSRKIVSRHKARMAFERKEKEVRAHHEASRFFTNSDSDSLTMSKKNALRVIRARTGLPKDLIRKAINSVYRELFG